MSADAHDAALALVSHAPHVVSSLMAARLADAPMPAVALAGAGVSDVTRVAGGDWRLWSQILAANAPAVTGVLEALRDDLDATIRALRGHADAQVVVDLLRQGIAGRGRLPGKHGGTPTAYAVVSVLVPDRPKELARLFRDASAVGVNIEDVSIDHAPGMPFGLVELSVRPDSSSDLAAALRSAGWSIQE
jgi:prephenate dehydrogenase